jgi:hypothetical protein
VQVEGGRLEGEADIGMRNEVEQQLVRGAGANRGHRSGEACLDVAVVMTADDALDVRVAADDGSFGVPIGQRHAVHDRHAGFKRGVVLRDHRWPMGLREPAVYPLQPL